MRKSLPTVVLFFTALFFAVVAAAQAVVPVVAPVDALPAWGVAVIQIVVALSGLLASVFAFLKTKAGKGLTNAIENDAASKASVFASNTIFELALAALETSVKAARAGLADGTVTREEFDEICASAKAGVLGKAKELTIGRLLGSGAAPTAEAAVSFIADKLEASMPGVKAASANPPTPSA